jgi:hypothetical protein
MSFANINIGTTPGDHSGDPLRTAFNKINSNFQQIANGTVTLNLNAPVQSVAGRTGNVVLTASDVIGSLTAGNLNSALASFSADYPNNTALANNIANLVGGAPSGLNTLGKIAASLGNVTAFADTVNSNIGVLTAQVNNLWANAAVQAGFADSLTAANLAIAQNTSDIQVLYANTATQATTLSTLTANAATQAGQLTTLTANAATQDASLSSLLANAAVQNTSLSDLLANAAIQDSSLVTLLGNAVAQQSTLSNLLANTATLQSEINGANAAIITANTGVVNYVNSQIASVNQTWGANAANVQSQFANLTTYIDTTANTINAYWQSNLTAANANVITSNTAMKSYVDASNSSMQSYVNSVTSSWTANAATQQGLIATLQGQVYANSNVAAYLPTYTGNLTAGNTRITGNLKTSGTFAQLKNEVQGFTTFGSYVSGTASAIVTINSTIAQPTISPGTLQVVGPSGNSAFPVHINLDAHTVTNAPIFVARRSRGLPDAPTAVQALDQIGGFGAKGWGGTGYDWPRSSVPAGFHIFAAENYTETAHGTYSVVTNIVNGTTNQIYHTRFDNSGNLVIVQGSTSTSPTTGALVVGGGAGIGGNINASGDINALGKISSQGNLFIAGNLLVDRHLFANGAAYSLPWDTISANTYIKNYGGNAYIGGIQVANSSMTGDGSGRPLTFDFTQTIATHVLKAEETLIANSSVQATTAYTGAFQVPNGGAGIQGNLFCAVQPNTRLQVGQGGTYFGNVIGQFTGDVNSYLQINMQNLRQDTKASSDFVATADIGTDDQYYVNMGINNSTFADTNYPAMAPLDSYLVADGGNLLLSAERVGKTITFMQGGYTRADIVGTWGANNFSITTPVTLGNVIQFANLTTSQVTALPSPQPGMTVYNYTTGNIQVYNGTKWANITLS